MRDFSKHPSGTLEQRLQPLIMPVLVALVGLAAFGLGRLSVGQGSSPRLVINAPTQTAAVVQGAAAPAAALAAGKGAYVASKSGTKYYLPSCGGVGRIKEENKVWFDSVAEAQAAGYEPAANCPGL